MKDVIKEVPSFIKILKEYFWNIKTNGYNGRRVHNQILILHDTDLADLIEIIKEDMNEFKIYLKEQAVSYHSTEMTGWCIKLHLDIDIKSMKGFFDEEIKS